MNRELKYNGKTLDEMTSYELEEQYEINKKRIVGRSAFFTGASIVGGIIAPYSIPIILGIGAATDYQIANNNKEIQKTLTLRKK